MAQSFCEINPEVLAGFVEERILSRVPAGKRDSLKSRILEIAKKYEGRDADAVSVLFYAAERDRLEEYAGKLERHFEESLQYVHPEARRLAVMPGAVRAERFILDCYKEMRIKPVMAS